MKALVSRQPGGPDSLELADLPDPQPGAGEVRIAVRACGVNYPDTLIIADRYQFRPERPFAPGCEVAGTIDAVGEGVEGFAVGQRVCGTSIYGGMAEKMVVPAVDVFDLPDDRSFEEGSALLLAYLTSIHALLDRGELTKGDTLLVLGAAGGVGLSAVELGKAFGARVVAAVSSEEKAEIARSRGADEAVVYPLAPLDKAASKELANAFKAACGKDGADVIVDAVGGDYSEPALRAIAWEGRFLVVGFPAGIAKLPLNLPLLKACDIRGVFLGGWSPRNREGQKAHVAHLFRLWSEGKIAPLVSETFPLERGGEGIKVLVDRRALGKVVITI